MICNSAEDELLLAAQLGRSLLEKNEELSRVIADQKFQLSDKDLEISFLRKQVERLRDLNDSRMKQLEHYEATLKELESEKGAWMRNCTNQKDLISQLKESLQEMIEKQWEAQPRSIQLQPERMGSSQENKPIHRRNSVSPSISDSEKSDCDGSDRDQLYARAARLESDLQRLKRDFTSDSQVILGQLETYRYELGEVCRWLVEDFISWAKYCENGRTERPALLSEEREEERNHKLTNVSLYAELKMSDNSDSGCCVGIPTGLENETEIRCLSPIGTESEMPPSSDYKKIFEEIYLLLKKFNLNSADHKRTS